MRIFLRCPAVFLALFLGAVARADEAPVPAAPAEVAPLNAPLPTAPGQYKLRYRFMVDGKAVQMSYLLYVPPHYAASKDPLPLLVFLHGAGECGVDLAGIYVHGPTMELLRNENAGMRATFPAIVVSPQCPPRGERWDQPAMIKTVAALVRELSTKMRVDRDRIYCTGLSMGGTGTWHLALEAPDLFAAIAPISAVAVRPEEAATKLAGMNIWTISGMDDGGSVEGARTMANALKDTRADYRMSLLPGVGHDAWGLAFHNPSFYEWLFSQRKLLPAERSAAPRNNRPTTLPTVPGIFDVRVPVKLADVENDLAVELFLPRGYTPKASPMPIVVFFRDDKVLGHRAATARPIPPAPPGPAGIHYSHGVIAQLEAKGNEQWRGNFNLIVSSPAIPVSRFTPNDAEYAQIQLQAIDNLVARLRVDPQRVYLAGLDGGLRLAFSLAQSQPDRFAGILAATSRHADISDDLAKKIGEVPVWLSLPQSDGDAWRRAEGQIKQWTAPHRLEAFANDLQDDPDAFFRNAELYVWLQRQPPRTAAAGR